MTTAAADAPRITLDTNVLLDWLVFKERAVAGVVAAVESGAVRWVACAAMRSEFERTLGYDNLSRWQPDRAHALSVFDRYADVLEQPATLPLLRSSDPDDQVFIDLAVASQARWLLTHDRALLRLARRARSQGVAVLRPQGWQLNLQP